MFATKAKIERMAKYARSNVAVNSGALVQADFEGETVEVVEPAAWSHVAPHYEFSAEAPRVYDDEKVTAALWTNWLLDVIEREDEYRQEQSYLTAYLDSFEEA